MFVTKISLEVWPSEIAHDLPVTKHRLKTFEQDAYYKSITAYNALPDEIKCDHYHHQLSNT